MSEDFGLMLLGIGFGLFLVMLGYPLNGGFLVLICGAAAFLAKRA